MPVASPLASPAFHRMHANVNMPAVRIAPRMRPLVRAPQAPGVAYAVGFDARPAAAAAPATLRALKSTVPTVWRACGAHIAHAAGPGTLLGSHPFLTASGGLLGAVATGALAHDIFKKLPPEQKERVRQALRQLARGIETVGPYATSLILGAASGTLAQEGAVRWMQEDRHASAALMLLASLPLGLVSLETLGKKLEIPVLRQAWSGPSKFCEQHQRDVGGSLLGATGMASAHVATRMLAANNPWGWVLMAGALPAVLGGLELVGREHNIAALRQCLTQPVEWTIKQVRRVVSADVALQTVGAALAMAGMWGVATGWQQLALPQSGLGDAIGAAQITAGTLATGLGAGLLAERRKWVPSAQHVFERYNDAMASAVFSAWGAALSKFAAFNILAFGPAYLNTGAAAIGLGLMGTGIIASFRQTQKKIGANERVQHAIDPVMDERISSAVDRTWALSGSMASGAWAALVGRGLLCSGHDTALLSALNAVPQFGATAVLGAVSLGMLGYAINNASMKRVSNDVADNVKDGVEKSLVFAQTHPAPTLAALGVLLALAKQAI